MNAEHEKQDIVIQFAPMFEQHRAECWDMIRKYLTYRIARVRAERDALPARGENTLENRQRERMASAEWKSKNPIPTEIITAESVALLCVLNDSLLDSGELSELFVEQKGLQRMVPTEFKTGINDVLLAVHRHTRIIDAQVALKRVQRHWPEQKQEDGQLSAVLDMQGKQLAETSRLADANIETQRLLHRATRKLDGVPPAMQKLKIATHSMANATMQFRQLVKLDDDDWEIYDRIEHKNQNQSMVARDLGMKPYQVSRAWGRIVDAFYAAGYPIAKKFSLRSAKLAEDGMIVAKNRKKRKQFQKPRPSA